MLSHEDNVRLTRIGPGTPGGELFRRYWQPALLSVEIPENDCAPVRVRLLGEDLIGFRNSEGRIGLVDANCPHRRAPMFYGRNEECGLRCVYHGWKFDVDGNCVDLPSEPADSPMKAKAKIKTYLAVERGGVIWAYMGPPELRPPEPDYEWTRAPETHRHVSKSYQACNYLQGLEGGLDTAHVTYLHNNDMAKAKQNLFGHDGAPTIDVEETDYGYYYVSKRAAPEGGQFVRVYQYMLPSQQMRPNFTNTRSPAAGRNEVARYDGHIWVPIDDGQTFVYNWMCGYGERDRLDPEYVEQLEAGYGRGKDDYIPGTFRLKASPANDYFIDREVQKTQTFTGIKGVNTQDLALQEEMGAITNRSLEFLGSSDTAIIALRKVLTAATQSVEKGETPRGTDPSAYRDAHPYDGVVPEGADWRDAFADGLSANW